MSGYRTETVAGGEYYRASAANHQQLALSWRFQCVVQAAGAGGTTSATAPATLLDPALDEPSLNPRFGNFRVRGIDVFQVVQPNAGARTFAFSPVIGTGDPSQAFGLDTPGGGTPTSYRSTYYGAALPTGADAQHTAYAGVPLDSTHHAAAVVYVDMTDTGDVITAQHQKLDVTLFARTDGEIVGRTKDQPLGDSRTVTVPAPPISHTPYVTAAERDQSRFGVQFTLPSDWLAVAAEGKQLDLEARVAFHAGFTPSKVRECATGACGADNRFRLDDIPVHTMRPLRIRSVQLREADDTWNTPPQDVLQQAKRIFPGGELMSIASSGAWLNISDQTSVDANSNACLVWKGMSSATRLCRQGLIDDKLNEWEFRSQGGIGKDPTYDALLGLHDYANEPGWTLNGKGTLTAPAPLVHPTFTANAGTLSRPLTAAAHELGHVLGLEHAGKIPPSCSTDPAGEGEDWPQDQQGLLQGTKFDWWSAPAFAPVDPVVDGNSNTALFDLMSYCASEGRDNNGVYRTDAWLSPRNWNHAIWTLEHMAKPTNATAARTLTSAARAPARVAFGVLGPAGGRVVRLVPLPDGVRVPPAAPSSPVTLRALDGGDRLLGEVGVLVSGSSEAPAGSGGSFTAAVPAAATAVELVRDGLVLDRIQRSGPPRVRLLPLTPRRRVRAADSLLVRWSASDPDGGPLEATVDYSPDGRRGWTTLYQGPTHDRGLTRIPGRVLASGRRARIRVALNDGFDETRTVSAPFRADGTPPQVQILRPRARDAIVQGARTLLSGFALADTHRAIRGRALTWYAGGRRVGRGSTLSARLPVGRVRLRLVARDRAGRTGVASIHVVVQRPPLRLLAISYPHTLAHSARTIAVRIRASERSILRAANHRYSVGPHTKRIVLPLPRLRISGVLRIHCKLLATGGRQLRGTIVLQRR